MDCPATCVQRAILAKVDLQRSSCEIKEKVANERRTEESKTELQRFVKLLHQKQKAEVIKV